MVGRAPRKWGKISIRHSEVSASSLGQGRSSWGWEFSGIIHSPTPRREVWNFRPTLKDITVISSAVFSPSRMLLFTRVFRRWTSSADFATLMTIKNVIFTYKRIHFKLKSAPQRHSVVEKLWLYEYKHKRTNGLTEFYSFTIA